MGEVIALMRVMPGEVIEDEKLNKIIKDIKVAIKSPAKLGRIEIKEIAFGLKGLNVTVSVPDGEGGLDPIVETLSKIENVDSVEVTDVGRI
ncbi:MAG: elongation factor 1-beta [Candidatus Thermoplasmatota archaeon]|nr:elongation factor 1-beta [Candidatus Thermoplasmatota archaeon]